MTLNIRNTTHRENVSKVYQELEDIDIGEATDVLEDKDIKKFEKWLELVKDELYNRMHQFDLKQIKTLAVALIFMSTLSCNNEDDYDNYSYLQQYQVLISTVCPFMVGVTEGTMDYYCITREEYEAIEVSDTGEECQPIVLSDVYGVKHEGFLQTYYKHTNIAGCPRL